MTLLYLLLCTLEDANRVHLMILFYFDWKLEARKLYKYCRVIKKFLLPKSRFHRLFLWDLESCLNQLRVSSPTRTPLLSVMVAHPRLPVESTGIVRNTCYSTWYSLLSSIHGRHYYCVLTTTSMPFSKYLYLCTGAGTPLWKLWQAQCTQSTTASYLGRESLL